MLANFMNRRLARVVGIAVATLALAALTPLPSRAAVTGPVTTLVDEAPGAIQFEVTFGPPRWEETTLNGVDYRFPSWPTLPGTGDSGDPALPLTVVRVAVPPGAVSVSAATRERGRAMGVRFPPVTSYQPIDPRTRLRDPMVLHTESVEGPRFTAGRALPPAEILSDGIERGVRILNVGVRPVSFDPATGSAVWASAVTVTVSLPPGAAALPARPAVDRVGQASFDRDLVNPGDAARWSGAAADEVPALPTATGVPATWFDDADGWAKIRIESNGVYRLDRNVLENMGVPVGTVDPRTFRLFAGPLVPHLAWTDLGWVGNRPVWQHVYQRPEFAQGFDGGFGEIPMLVRGNLDDGTMDASDALVFYALGPDNYRERFGLAPDSTGEYIMNPYTSQTVYWLAWGGDFAGSPRRMAVEDATPAPGAPVVTDGRTRIHFENIKNRDSIYDPSMYDGGYPWPQWFWASISTSNPAGQGFLLNLPQALSGSTFDVRIRLWGSQVPLAGGGTLEEARHHVHVRVNSVDLGTPAWGGSFFTSFTHLDVTGEGIPTGTPDTLKLVVPQVGTNPDRYDQVYLTWVDATYTRRFDAGGNPAEFSVDAGESGRTVRVSRPPSGAPLVLDVTDPRNPRRLTGVRISGSGTGAIGEFAVGSDAARTVAVASDDDLLTPAAGSYRDDPPAGENGSPTWLRDATSAVDYVLVVGDGFEDAAEVLAQWRRNNLLGITESRPARVQVVRVSDIMDEFTWGMWDPIAIRYFLEYMYRYYGPGEDRLSYCVFLGDHTYDPRDFHQNGIPDIVPSWEDNRSGISDIRYGNIQYATDDPLARFDGYDTGLYDNYTDLILGRIPARTAAELRGVIEQKIKRAEEAPSYGPWRTKAILIADDNCQGRDSDSAGSTHMPISEEVDAVIPFVFDRSKVYLYEYGETCTYDSKPAAKRALLDAWDDGAWLVNYVGHGGNVVMADEHVFDVADVPVLTNDGRLPVLGAFSCSVGKFNKATQEGIGEALVLQPRTGTIVSAAATHLTSPGNNKLLNKDFMRRLFPGGNPVPPVPIGAALMEAKRLQANENDRYICLGDPASLLNVPGSELAVTGPDTLKAGVTPEFSVRREDGAGTGGTLDVLAQGPMILRSKNSQGQPIPGFAAGSGYRLPGARLFSGRSAIAGDSASVAFTVPRSIRDGQDARVRIYGSGTGWDGAGIVGPLPTDPRSTGAVDDTTGPTLSFSSPSTEVSAGDEMELRLEDPSGINLTRAFPVFSILLKVFDPDGRELLRLDLTDRFQYDEGSHTQGRVVFNVPDLVPGTYDFVVTAADNNGFTSRLTATFQLGAAARGAAFSGVLAYPNPFDPERESTRVMFTLNRGAKVTARVYSVAGRLVWTDEKTVSAGPNAFLWNGRDRGGDRVANGVYLVQLDARPSAGGGRAKHLERVVVLR